MVTFARCHFLGTSSQIVLVRKWMLACPPSVSTTFYSIQEVRPSRYENERMEITLGIIQWLKRYTGSLSQDPCVIRTPKMAILLLSVHPLTNQCLLHLHLLMWLTFLHTCPRVQLMTVLALDQNPPWCFQRAGGAWPSAGFHSNWWPNLTSTPLMTGNLPTLLSASPGSKDCHGVLSQCGPQTVDVLPGFPSQV